MTSFEEQMFMVAIMTGCTTKAPSNNNSYWLKVAQEANKLCETSSGVCTIGFATNECLFSLVFSSN